jgi:hypothetical protein
MPRDLYRRGTILLSAALMAIGVAIVVRTIDAGVSGLSAGILLGALFVLAGAGRLWIALRGPR